MAIRESLQQLEKAAADAPPGPVRTVAELCLRHAREAEAEVERATLRADLAESAVKKIAPHMDTLLVRTHEAEDKVSAYQRAEYLRRGAQQAAAKREREAVAKREGGEAAAESVAKSVAGLAEVVEARAGLIQKFITCHLQVEPSLVTCRARVGKFIVKTAPGAIFAVCESRAEALAAVDRLIEREKANQGLGPDPHQRKPQAGETEDAEESGGRLDGKRITRGRAAKRARIL